MSQDRTSFRRLGRDTLIYGIGIILSRAVSFFMLPVYTRYLTTADYGVLQLLDMTIDISYIVFTAGMTAGMSLFYFQASEEQERRDIVRTSFVLEMSFTVLGSAALMMLSPWIWRHGLRGAGEVVFLRITAINFALQMLSAVPVTLLQLRQRSQVIITINLVRLIVQLSLNILFVVVLRMGVEGILVTGLIVNSLYGFGLAIWMLRDSPGRIRMDIVKRLRRFGWPYQVSNAGSFLLSFGDRFFLQASRGASAVGLYGLAYQFGFLLHQLSTEQVLKAWNPQRLQLLDRPTAERDERYDRGFHYFNLILITMATGIGVFVNPVIQVMTTAPFHPAARLVPIILAAYVVQSWGEATQFGIGVSQKTKYMTYSTWAAVVVVVALYATLIPRYGGYGAAIATLIAFTVRFGLAYHWSQKLWRVRYSWGRNLLLAGYGTAAVMAAFLIPIRSIGAQLGLGAALTVAYAALAWLSVLSADDRSLMISLLRGSLATAAAARRRHLSW
jgi:O-antigen/teichoic acid export membrane protein